MTEIYERVSQPLQRTPSEQQRERSPQEPVQFSGDPELVKEALGLITVPSASPEIEFITEEILKRGGREGPEAFTKIMMKFLTELQTSPFKLMDRTEGLAMLLKSKSMARDMFSD